MADDVLSSRHKPFTFSLPHFYVDISLASCVDWVAGHFRIIHIKSYN